MEHVWLVLSLLHAVKVNDYELYAHTLVAMPDLFFSFRGLHYALCTVLDIFCNFPGKH